MDSVNNTADIREINVQRIMELIPHRYPFLMIDRMVDIVSGESATGIKNITMSEPCFQGHFPKKPIFPEVRVNHLLSKTSFWGRESQTGRARSEPEETQQSIFKKLR